MAAIGPFTICIDQGTVDTAVPAGGNTLDCVGRDWREGFFRPGEHAGQVGGQAGRILGNSDTALVVEGAWARPITKGAAYRIYVGPDLTADTGIYQCAPGTVAV